MRIKLDENMPTELTAVLAEQGHVVDTVMDEGLKSRPDIDVWGAAQQDGRFLITQDLDFSDARRFVPGTHRGLMLVRLTTPSRRALIMRVETAFRSEDVEAWSGCVVIATETKLRIRSAPIS